MDGARTAKSPSEVNIRRAVNGGFIVKHSYDNSMSGPSYTPPKEHAFAGHKEMMAHVHKATGASSKGLGEVDREASEEVTGRGTDTAQTLAPTKAQGRKAAKTHGAGVD